MAGASRSEVAVGAAPAALQQFPAWALLLQAAGSEVILSRLGTTIRGQYLKILPGNFNLFFVKLPFSMKKVIIEKISQNYPPVF